jgi:Ca2+-binding EF-hand superfamily protein
MQSTLLFTFVAALYAGPAALARAQSVPASVPATTPDVQQNFDQRFAQVDKNGDGVIDRNEAAAHPMLPKYFDDIDVNKDGRLTKEELQAKRQERRSRFLANFDEKFTAADRNGDGALTREEAQAGNIGRIVEHFDRIDLNKDRKVTREELRAIIRSRLGN